ncbi:class I SAM-dependent methyltransferase [Alienimonas chondri]|uniref:Methyltransferase type 11 domain-containing protein n=1 Tax=Alienimonas chondri TaxID=2681879 RepID=A0ABX1VBA0_9PLAN|nr:class I SAM-dependent methyltransferase [Alienimonas chondri]NNJ24572.1 hypothetical protein [Alienimonas chondri]
MTHLPRNAAAWDRLAREGSGFARVATDAQIADPRATLDARGWLPADLSGKHVLCLAAGGGWQSVLYAALGCRVTVVDLSEAMLDLDRREAARRGFESLITPMRVDMAALPDLPGAPFDLVHQPVSACYVPDLSAVYAGVARVLKPGGLYIVQHKQPASLQCFGPLPDGGYRLGAEYYRTDGTENRRLPDPDAHTRAAGLREAGCAEYLHTWRHLVGDLCAAGFVIEDLTEPNHADPQAPVGSAGHRGRFLPPYVRIKARRVEVQAPRSNLVLP